MEVTFQSWWDSKIEKNSETINENLLSAVRDIAGAAWVAGYNLGFKEGEDNYGTFTATKTKSIKPTRRRRDSSIF